MKKLIVWMFVFIMMVSLTACGNSDRAESTNHSLEESVASLQEESSDVEQSEGRVEHDSQTVLVAYFSWADNAAVEGEVDAVSSPSVTKPGNVEQLALWVQEKTGGELFSIRVTEPYPSDWDECLERANEEKADGARPELAQSVENMEDYDVIFLGYPNWWYSCPTAILSFLEEYDLSGKQIYLFCSHGTGGLASSVEDIRAAIPNSSISEHVFDVYEEDAASSKQDIEIWLEELGY